MLKKEEVEEEVAGVPVQEMVLDTLEVRAFPFPFVAVDDEVSADGGGGIWGARVSPRMAAFCAWMERERRWRRAVR